ncbi:MAG: biotin--[Clostridia bacterium]|nr:biotin--[acetyl-CoA-carboxylase] ligase [Clostridia bacterium]
MAHEIHDKLTVEGIKPLLDKNGARFNLRVVDSVGSTNDELKLLALNGAREGTVLVASYQTAGRGRFGRSFVSPDSGVYLSMLLRPSLLPGQAVRLTTAAAVAVCRALEFCGADSPQIKWVNDVYLHGKKVCGILTESGTDPRTGALGYAVVGVGINVYEPEGGFDPELRGKAGAVFPERHDNLRNFVTAEFLNSFAQLYANVGTNAHAAEYRSRCFVIGRKVTVQRGGTERRATVLDVDRECRLLVRYDDGQEEILSSGEISLKI